MNKYMKVLFSVIFLLAGLLAFPSVADVNADTQKVQAEASAILSGSGTPVEKQAALTELLNKVLATGDEAAIRNAIVAIMVAGGSDNLDLTKSAIYASDAASSHSKLVKSTVSTAEKIINPSAGADGAGDSGGDSPTEVIWNPAGGFGPIDDKDTAATPV